MTLPDRVDDAVADLAEMFHWSLTELSALSLEELAYWWNIARTRAEERAEQHG